MENERGINPAALRALVEGDLENFLVASTPGGIEQQEAAGQRDFVANNTLPIDIKGGTKEQFEQMGIVFGGALDDLFCCAQLPIGWEKVPTDHSMWSNLVDEQGRERAAIFYKAAFYDRSAFLSIKCRFSHSVMPVTGWDDYDRETTPRKAVVLDGEKIIWESESVAPTEQLPSYRITDSLEPFARQWLSENYPDWTNPLAYWD